MKFTQSVMQEGNFYQEPFKKRQKKVNFMRNQQQEYIDESSNHDFNPNNNRNKSYKQRSESQSESERNLNHKNNDDYKGKDKNKKSQKISSSVLIRSLFSYMKRVKVLPTMLVEQLQKREKKYDIENSLIYYPFSPKDKNFSVKTREGTRGVRELISFLQDLQSRQSEGLAKEVDVEWSHELHLAASMRVGAIQKGNSHTQSLDIGELVSQYCTWKGPLYEIVVYGFFDPKEILIEAFLQDESGNKNNRKQFFNEGGRYVGIDMGYHDKYQIVTVIIFAGGIGKVSDKKSRSYRSSDGGVSEECQCEIY